ncbi:M23 family metallopeptidase [Longispora albida]|uniref:M23 family metallopeptidase n=1 Tax=Longispora albida TaxID=203523 RepID=UPI0003620128|nr:M23 family metallopeptidase [Longispora albida]
MQPLTPLSRYRGWLRGALAAGTLLGALSVAALPAQAGPADEPAMRQAVERTLIAQRGETARAAYASPALETMVEPKRRQRNWVFGGAIIRVPGGVEASPVTALFLAEKTRAGWTVSLEGTREFATAAGRAPESVVDAEEKALFSAPAPLAGTPTGLALPWELNKGWAHWGVHGNSGTSRPYNSIDFYGGDGKVRASRAGKLYRFCTSGGQWPYLKVVHDNGYTTGYYHLSSTTTKGDGSAIALGEFLGDIDVQLPCGGRANGDHVHWTLWQGDTAIAVQGKDIGGWTWYEGSQAYAGYAERNGTKIYGNSCCNLVNYGAGGPAPTGSAATVNSGTYSSVNVRSGPGTSYSVIGSHAHNDVIQVACTASGSSVTGPYGTTSVWDKKTDGGYISAAFVKINTGQPAPPAC